MVADVLRHTVYKAGCKKWRSPSSAIYVLGVVGYYSLVHRTEVWEPSEIQYPSNEVKSGV
jgi:hypothetical protein